jgi:hypothetical protein
MTVMPSGAIMPAREKMRKNFSVGGIFQNNTPLSE